MQNKSNKEFTPEFLNNLIRKLRFEYSTDPNIKHISWGLGKSKGKLNKGVCIIFTVHQKTNSEKVLTALRTHKIPNEIEGVPTDIQVGNAMKLSSAVGSRGDVIADPLNGGWTSSNADNHIIWFNGWGTIGLLCTDNETGDLMALSNWHVWADGGEEGDTIIQPGIPRTGDNVEGVAKVLACGPILTSILEWESPDPIALGLYGGAAALAIAAALSDYRDPSRRGQDATIPGPGEKTMMEKIVVDTVYKDLPIPGTPFKTDVKWNYERHTDANLYEHSVSENQINAQFLLGKYVTSDKQAYNPGEKANIYTAIWDYQPRPCDGYHVVAHMVSEDNPSIAYPVILHPSECSKRIPWYPPSKNDDKIICYDFGKHKPGTKFHFKHHFDWLHCYSMDEKNLIITDWQTSNGGKNKGELMIGQKGLRFTHNPSSAVNITVAAFTNQPIIIKAYDYNGIQIGSAQSTGKFGSVETISFKRQGIAGITITGGGGEGVVLKYCVSTDIENEQIIEFSPEIYTRLETAHVKFKDNTGRNAKANRCCFEGSFRIPPMEVKGRWNIYLTVQNVNNVPQGTKPEIAAETIGGHLLTAPVAQVAGCLFMMLGDHVFDIF
ncbi:hypothetical protein [Aurantibacter sp.]|uniref:hypothetical protein n=1 Tax=Aurantibacter sp. TaxID=2807103 RepID=UPI0032646B16